MPIGQHASGVNTLQVIFTVLHAGGKFSSEGGYKTAGGLHGVGASVVNALSEWLTVEVAHDGELVRMEFADGGKKIGKLEHLGKDQSYLALRYVLNQIHVSSPQRSTNTMLCVKEHVKKLSY